MRFFNKDFFKFTIGFILIVILSMFLIMAVSAYAVGIDKITFITNEQTIKVNTISEALTIQTQDSQGNSVQTPETIDINFSSDSPTGEFLNSAGSAATKTMSKNTANKTFYYRDSSDGTHIITVTATGRDTGTVWSASQNIIIGNSTTSSNSANNQNTTTNASSGSNTSTQSQSSTSGPKIPLYGNSVSDIEVLAGNDRIATLGTPVKFQAYVKKNSNYSLIFEWSFGDGNVGSGAIVDHTYKYSGDYAVVLNARAGNSYSVSRSKVKVIDPKIELNPQNGFVEIKNTGDSEINIYNWRIGNEGKSFIFQPDTIILPKSSIRVDDSMFKMKWALSSSTELFDSLNRSYVKTPSYEDVTRDNIRVSINRIENEVSNIKSRLVTINNSNSINNKQVATNTKSQEVNEKGNIEQGVANANIIYESVVEPSMFNRLTNFIKSILYK